MKIDIILAYHHLLWADALWSLLAVSDVYKVSKPLPYKDLQLTDFSKIKLFLLEATFPNAELLQQVKYLKNNNQKVIIVGYIIDNEFVDLLVNSGVDGYVLKTCGKENLFSAIHQIFEGRKYFCAPVTEILSNRLSKANDANALTQRELEVLVGVVSVKHSSEIAKGLNISEATVRTHRKNIMRKFGAKNYLGLLRYACRKGLLDSVDEQFCQNCQSKMCHNNF